MTPVVFVNVTTEDGELLDFFKCAVGENPHDAYNLERTMARSAVTDRIEEQVDIVRRREEAP